MPEIKIFDIFFLKILCGFNNKTYNCIAVATNKIGTATLTDYKGTEEDNVPNDV